MKDDNQDKPAHQHANPVPDPTATPSLTGFIVTEDYAIAESHIDLIRFGSDGSVTVTVGRDSLSFEAGSPDAELFNKLIPRPKPPAAAGAAADDPKAQQGSARR